MRNPSLRIWAKLLPHPLLVSHGTPALSPPAVPAGQSAAPAAEIDVLTGKPVLPSDQARPSTSPTAIIPLLTLALALAARPVSAALNNFRVTPCTHLPGCSRADTSQPIQALTGTHLTRTRPNPRLQEVAEIAQTCAWAGWPAFLSQLSISRVPAEFWAAAAAFITAAALIAKKLLPRAASRIGPHASGHASGITCAEFHAAMDATRDRIDATSLALANKIEQKHNQVLTKLDCQGANFERRLDQIESNLARLDERTNSLT